MPVLIKPGFDVCLNRMAFVSQVFDPGGQAEYPSTDHVFLCYWTFLQGGQNDLLLVHPPSLKNAPRRGQSRLLRLSVGDTRGGSGWKPGSRRPKKCLVVTSGGWFRPSSEPLSVWLLMAGFDKRHWRNRTSALWRFPRLSPWWSAWFCVLSGNS